MDGIQGSSGAVNAAASLAASVIKDSTGAQLISKTLDKMNTGLTAAGPKVNADYQFQKDVLNAAGIGTKIDTVA